MARVAPPQFRAPPKVCVYCGNAATTRDHVPPRAVFVPPVPANLKTVPACRACNDAWARSDQEFVPSAMLAASVRNPRMLDTFRREIMPNVSKNRKFHEDIFATQKPIAYDIQTRQPTLYEMGTPAKPIIDMGSRLVRAFHWIEHRRILAPDVPIEVLRVEDLNYFDGKPIPWKQRNIGDHLHYGFVEAEDRPDWGVWYFVFYEGLLLTAWVGTLPGGTDK